MKMAASVGETGVSSLTIAQTRKALIKKKKVFRNLIVNPYTEYWPSLSEEENARFTRAFERIAQAESKVETTKKDDKELVKLKRKKWSEVLEFSVNSVSRCVMKGTVIAVLLADDVDPKFLVQHLATLCGVAAVPVLAVASLRMFTKRLLGFSSIAIGLKKTVADTETNSFRGILELILGIGKGHMPPRSIRQFHNVTPEKFCGNESYNEKPVLAADKPSISVEQTVPAGDVYLYRTSRESRAFVPKLQNPKKSDVVSKPKTKLEDFMSLGEDSDFDELMETEIPIRGISHVMQKSEANEKRKPFSSLKTESPIRGISASMLNPDKNRKRKPSPPPYVPLKHIKVKPNPNKKPH